MVRAKMIAMNIWTKKFGLGRRFTCIGPFFFKNAGRGRRSDIGASDDSREISRKEGAPTRDLRGAPGTLRESH
jgi:hypothetical protein